jgi:uncharacterized protein (TIGR02246 family)
MGQADRFGHQSIETGHLLLGILAERRCLAAEILSARGVSGSTSRGEIVHSINSREPAVTQAKERSLALGRLVDQLLAAWSGLHSDRVAALFAKDGCLWDARGERHVGQNEIQKAVSQEFSRPGFAANQGDVREVRYLGSDFAVIVIIWAAGKPAEQPQRRIQTVLIAIEGDPDWQIASAHISELQA